jgi:O-antigen ligase
LNNSPTPKLSITEWLRYWLPVILCGVTFLGFVTNRVVASQGMILLVVYVILTNPLTETFKNYIKDKQLLVLSIFFWIVLLSGIYSADTTGWLNWVRIKLPYLFLPIAFAGIKWLDTKRFTAILVAFAVIMTVSTASSMSYYITNFEGINNSFLWGHAIPVPFSHIRFSLMLAFAVFVWFHLFRNKMYVFAEWEKYVQIIAGILCFIALHILSVRSGLVAVYSGILYLVLRFIFIKKNVLLGLSLLGIFIAIPILSYNFIPTIKNKVEYMKYDLAQYQKGEVNDYSDVMRLVSMQVGLEVAKQNLAIGVGAGDLNNEVKAYYVAHYPQVTKDINRKLPHNQFIWVLASLGIIGLVLFLFAFFFPLFQNGNYKMSLFVILHIILFTSFFTEHTLEEQIGTGFYLIFLLVLANHIKGLPGHNAKA